MKPQLFPDTVPALSQEGQNKVPFANKLAGR